MSLWDKYREYISDELKCAECGSKEHLHIVEFVCDDQCICQQCLENMEEEDL